MPKTKISVSNHGLKSANNLTEAQAIGLKLQRLGAMLTDPTKVEIVDRDFFNRKSDSNSMFFAFFAGDNGKYFQVALNIDQLANDKGFGGR